MESIYYAMLVFPLSLLAGIIGGTLIYYCEELTKKQTVFLVFIGGPLLWVSFLILGIYIIVKKIYNRIIISKLVKWVWNDILG